MGSRSPSTLNSPVTWQEQALSDFAEFVVSDFNKLPARSDQHRYPEAPYAVRRIEMKRLHSSLETGEYHLNYVRRRISRG